jgi:hypothetical protein
VGTGVFIKVAQNQLFRRENRGEKLHAPESSNQSKSGMEHVPGPRGSPHEPHPPEVGADALEEFLADTAKTESCGARCLLRHLGQAAFWLPKIRASKRCSHLVQTYSKIGMCSPPG